jgi:hypothetical protein
LPPAEYDHPYNGKLTVERTTAEKIKDGICGFPGSNTVGCTFAYQFSCSVFIADDAALAARGVTFDTVLRHEIGHCNGWPSDHSDLKSFEWPKREGNTD